MVEVTKNNWGWKGLYDEINQGKGISVKHRLWVCGFLKNFYWSIVDLQCCVSFRCSAKWISYIYIYVPISLPSCVSLPPTLPIPPLKVVTKHRADLPVLCGCFPLASYFTFGSVYMSVPLSHFVPAYPSPFPVSSSPFSSRSASLFPSCP